jgi:phospholipid/cholesterol/gamma-HCH transport system permease protein
VPNSESVGAMNQAMARIIHEFEGLGRFGLFVYESLSWFKRQPYRWKLFIDELEFIGNQSLFIVTLTATFTGAVFAYQSWLAFSMVGTESLVGPSVGLSLVRELAPVMTGLVVTGRAGAAIAAQIGIMRVTEQIDALEVMGISPQQYLVLPRIVSATLAVPLLVALFGLIGNLGGYLVAVYVCGVDPGIYVTKLKYFLDPWDFYHGVIKGIFFGFLIGSIGCYKGYVAKNGVEGVGKATNDAVVFGTVTILVLDYFLSVLIPTGIRSQ